FCASKDAIQKMKRQPTEGKSTFANHLSDRGLESKIDKELLQLNNKKTNGPVKRGKGSEKTFLHVSIQMANRYMKRCLIAGHWGSCTLKRTQITSHPTTITRIKKSDDNKCWQGCREFGTIIHCWWGWKMVQPLWAPVLQFLTQL
ncbi:LORF2 protein, partial [Crocuta crocuta]